MEPKEKYPYPAGYEHVAKRVALDVERIRGIDAELERLRNAPERDGFRPRNAPDGAPVMREPTNAEMTAYQQGLKEQIQKDSFELVDKEAAREKDPAKQRALREAGRDRLYGNPYEGMGKEQMHATRQQQGNINPEQSADYMDAQRGRAQSGPRPSSKESPKTTAQPEKSKFLTPTAYAMQSLTYTRLTKQADNAPGKSPATELNQAEQDKPQEKHLRPSELASLLLTYTTVTQQADNASSPSIEPEQDLDGPDLDR